MAFARIALFALAALVFGCAEPLPPAKASYVGEWHAEKMSLAISADGYVSYVRRTDRGKTSINAPIQSFDGDDFTVGVGPFNTKFVVSKPPHRDGATWKMTVDGVDLVRGPGPADATA